MAWEAASVWERQLPRVGRICVAEEEAELLGKEMVFLPGFHVLVRMEIPGSQRTNESLLSALLFSAVPPACTRLATAA